MMCRLLHSISRGLRHKAQANATHPPWTGNGSHQSRPPEDNIYTGLGVAYHQNSETLSSEKRSSQLLTRDRNVDSLVGNTYWKWGGRRSFTGKKSWESFDGKGSNHTSHDALEWGTAVIFSLHLCRAITAATLPDDSSNGKKKLVNSLAGKLPGLMGKPLGSLNLASQQDDVKKAKVNEPLKKVCDPIPPSPLEGVMAQLQSVMDQSVGQAHNYLGVKQAQEGCLEQAAYHFMEGSKVGFSKATFNLAVCCEQGRGVSQDHEKAADLYLEAAMQGHPQAKYSLGVFHLIGTGGVKQDTAVAMELINSAAAAGVTKANSYLGIHFLKSPEHKDEEKAVTFLQKAVEKQDTDAQYHLGLCYEHGLGVPMNTAKAASLYHRAAQKSHPVALNSLARFHEIGLGGLPINREQALQLYKQASQEGHQPASQYLEQLQNDPTADTHIEHRTNETSCIESDTLKLSKTRELVHSVVHSITLHMSVSAPSLGYDHAKEDNISENQHFEHMHKGFSISNLNLLLPYYFNLPSRPSLVGLTPSKGHSSQIRFQIGGDDEEGNAEDGAFSVAGNRFNASPQWLTVS